MTGLRPANLYERIKAFDNVSVLEVLEDLDLFEAVLSGLWVHHIEDCNLAVWEVMQSSPRTSSCMHAWYEHDA